MLWILRLHISRSIWALGPYHRNKSSVTHRTLSGIVPADWPRQLHPLNDWVFGIGSQLCLKSIKQYQMLRNEYADLQLAPWFHPMHLFLSRVFLFQLLRWKGCRIIHRLSPAFGSEAEFELQSLQRPQPLRNPHGLRQSRKLRRENENCKCGSVGNNTCTIIRMIPSSWEKPREQVFTAFSRTRKHTKEVLDSTHVVLFISEA